MAVVWILAVTLVVTGAWAVRRGEVPGGALLVVLGVLLGPMAVALLE